MSLTLQKANRIPSVLVAIHRAANQGVDHIKNQIAEAARDRAPVDSGELRDSIQVTDDGIEATAPHALFVEVGTEFVSPQPFLSPSTQDAERDLLDLLAVSLK